MLPEEYKLPEEWRAATIDRESVVGMVKAEMERMERERRGSWIVKRNAAPEVLRKTFDWMQKFASVSGTVVGGTVYSSLPWAGFRFLLQVRRFSLPF
jgi:myo-inositol catabolism protein IolC